MNTVKMIPFAEFVASQRADRELNHEDWHSCAVGDWVATNQVHFDSYYEARTTCLDETKLYELPHAAMLTLENEGEMGETLHDYLDTANRIGSDEAYPVGTYGELHKLIQDCTRYAVIKIV